MKKILSAILVLVLLVSVCVPAYASKKETTPFVLVSGMDVLPLYKDYGTENEKKVWGLSGDSFLTLGKELVKPLAMLALNGNKADFTKGLLTAVDKMFEELKCDDNGDSIYNIATPTFMSSMADNQWVYEGETKDEQGILNAAVQKYGAENVYFFNYDWRLDPLCHADQLNELIESIKKDKGCDKVNLACCSMGGVVSMSYLYKYGHNSIKNFMLLSTAFQGVTAVGEMYQGELYLEKGALIRRVVNLGKGDLKEFLFKALMYAVDKVGLADTLVNWANGIIDTYTDDIYDILLKDVFGKMPGILDLVTADEYEASKAYMLDSDKNANLIKRCDEYIYNVQLKTKDILDKAMADGTGVYVVCQYNMQALPVSPSSDLNNDLLIDVKYASAGAVCADMDCTLPADYKQAVEDGHNHLSADNVVDASTCMYPDSTWFIKDQAHVDYNVGETTDFLFWLADSETQLTVFDNANYSQFMIFNYDDNTLKPINSDYKEPFDYFSLITNILETVFSLFEKMMNAVYEIVVSL
ncbi:MAG: hypothetical protein MJ147_02830 [Clostridia bacterium]|nr:hypothetical protein [Clostridia bacterium]